MLQGVGAAGIIGLTSALLRTVFPRAQLGQALGINAMLIGTSVAAGPTIGGAILAFAPWPWLFLINVPIGIAVVYMAGRNIPQERGHGEPLHVPSIITSALGFALIVHGIDGFGHGEARPLIALELAAGFGAFGWFLAHQHHLERPMFAVDLYSRPLFALASISGLLCVQRHRARRPIAAVSFPSGDGHDAAAIRPGHDVVARHNGAHRELRRPAFRPLSRGDSLDPRCRDSQPWARALRDAT